MIQVYHVQLNSLYLTADGMTGGTKYLVEVEGIDSLMNDYATQETFDIHGNMKVYTSQVDKKGKQLNLRLLGVTFALAKSLKDLKNSQDSSGDPVNLILTHPYSSDFTFDLLYNISEIKWKGFLTTTWREVEIIGRTFEEN